MKKTTRQTRALCAMVLPVMLATPYMLKAQSASIEFGLTESGPSHQGFSTDPQVITFVNNANNPSDNAFVLTSPAITATFTLSDQQFTATLPGVAPDQGVSFGSEIGSVKHFTYGVMDAAGDPTNSMFKSLNGTTGGINVGDIDNHEDPEANRGIKLFVSSGQLRYAGGYAADNTPYYFGTLTIEFSHPLTDPVLQIAGLGGAYGGAFSQRGFSTDLELISYVASGSVSLSKIQGNTHLSVLEGNYIANTASDYGVSSTTSPRGAATGSVLAAGSGITSLTFKVYLKGKGGSQWSDTDYQAGDGTMIGVSALAPAVPEDDYSGDNTPGDPVTLNATDNDQNVDPATVSFVCPDGATCTDTDGDGDIDEAVVPGEGTWTVDESGNVTFTPEEGFTGDPTPIQYTVKNNNGDESAPATITVEYDEPLPVSLISFDAGKEGASVLLKWATANEVSNKGFGIERSVDGINWTKIGFVRSQSANGKSDTRQDYSFSDNNPVKGSNTYRLKQEDFDGKYVYSIARTVWIDANGSISIFPNPAATNRITLTGLKGTEHIAVFDESGRLVAQQKADDRSICTITIDKLSAGTYYIHITDSNGSQVSVHKFVRIK